MALFNTDGPRRHHYVFAHRQLLAVARRFAGTFPEMVRSGRLDTALAATWDRVGEGLPPADRLPGAGLTAALDERDGRHIVLVTMPRPEHGAEAYFAAIMVADDQLARYFVLEHGWTERDEPRTVLCEWDDQGRHINFGDGPPAEVNAFLSAVHAQLGRDRRAPRARTVPGTNSG
jgi:hypothetical protein